MVRVPVFSGGSILNIDFALQAVLTDYKLALSVPAGGEAGNFEMVFISAITAVANNALRLPFFASNQPFSVELMHLRGFSRRSPRTNC